METCLCPDLRLLPALTINEGLHMDVPGYTLSIYHALSPPKNNCPLAIAQAQWCTYWHYISYQAESYIVGSGHLDREFQAPSCPGSGLMGIGDANSRQAYTIGPVNFLPQRRSVAVGRPGGAIQNGLKGDPSCPGLRVIQCLGVFSIVKAQPSSATENTLGKRVL